MFFIIPFTHYSQPCLCANHKCNFYKFKQNVCIHAYLRKTSGEETFLLHFTTLISLKYFQQIVLGMRTGDIVYCDNLETHGNLSAIGHTSDIEYKVLGNVGSSVRQLINKGRNVVCLTGNIQLNL